MNRTNKSLSLPSSEMGISAQLLPSWRDTSVTGSSELWLASTDLATNFPSLMVNELSDVFLNGSSTNDSEFYNYNITLFRHSTSVSIIFCVAYAIVFLVGICGNSFVVAVVFRSPRMRTVTNYFIVNLALADILVLLFCLPATLVGNIFLPWMLGWFMCKSVSYLQGVSVSASINTLVAISLDRFLAICYPLRCQMSTGATRRIICVIWLFSLVIYSPWAIFFNVISVNSVDSNMEICVEEWPAEVYEKFYFLGANLILCYLLPLCIITFCYLCIWIKVWRRSIPGETKGAQMEYVMQRSKLKVVKMMVVVVVIFVMSWLPLYIIFTRVKVGSRMEQDSFENAVLNVLVPVAQWLGASNSCINPILYAYFNKKFRKGFVAIFKSRQCCGTLRFETRPRQSTTFRSAYRVNSRMDTQCDYLSTSAV